MCPARLLRSLESSRVFLAELGVHVREVEAVVQVFVPLDEHFVEYNLKFFKAFAPGRRTPLFAFEAERGGHECHGFDSGFSGDPYIICHMLESIDGRIDCDMTEKIDATNHYYECLDKLGCDACIEGRVTLQKHYAETGAEAERKHYALMHGGEYVPAGAQVYKAKESEKWWVGVDTRGSLYWGDDVEAQFDAPLVMILGGMVPTRYLDFLRSKGISYITTPMNAENTIDLRRAMEVLHEEFGVKRLAVVGGGRLNGSFLAENLLDEVSMIYAAGIDGRAGMAASFDGLSANRQPEYLMLKSAEVLDDLIWARYVFTPFEPNSLERRILNFLKKRASASAREIAAAIGADKTTVNSLLYGSLLSNYVACETAGVSPDPAPLWRRIIPMQPLERVDDDDLY